MNKEDFKNGIKWLRETAPNAAERFAPIYALLDWRWHSNTRSPTQSEIRQTIMQNIGYLKFKNMDKNRTEVDSGGIRVFIEKTEMGRTSVGIEFVDDFIATL